MKIVQQELMPNDIEDNIVARFQIGQKKVKCTGQERQIYGVDFKNDMSEVTIIMVIEHIFTDNKQKFYRIESAYRDGIVMGFYGNFSTKKAAIDFIKKTAKNKKD